VSHFERLPRSAAPNSGSNHSVLAWPEKHLVPEPRLYCAYNKTRQQFLCAHIELADLSPENQPEILSHLTPETARGLWLVPFRGITKDHVNSPIDLVFLDRNNCVLSVVESFPVAQPTSCNWPAGTALALPAQSVVSSGTLAGDQLILCSPEKMKRRFLNLNGLAAGSMSASGQLTEDLPSNPYSIAHYLPPIRKTPVQLTTWNEIIERQTAQRPPATAPKVPEQSSPCPVVLAPSGAEPASASKNWLFCLLAPHRRDKRRSQRQFLPWVAAYLFNTDEAAPTSVRNISMNGMYVLTSERWNLGTVVQVTLTDWRLPSPERSITVNAMAVRWGDDGIGLRFIFQKPGHSLSITPPLVDITPQRLKEFLQRFEACKRQSALRQ
jgi:hypothetical protein